MAPGVLKADGLEKFDQFLAIAEASGIYGECKIQFLSSRGATA